MDTQQVSSYEQLAPEAFSALAAARDAALTTTTRGLLDLCTQRIRMLLGQAVSGERGSAEKLAALADYATSPLFDETERLALEFTEQYVVDVASTQDPIVAALQERLGPDGLYGFVMGLYIMDQSQRLALSANVHPGVRA